MRQQIVKITLTPQELLEVKQRAARNGFAEFGQKIEGSGKESTKGLNKYYKWAEAQLDQTKATRLELVKDALAPLVKVVSNLGGLTQEETDLINASLARRSA